MYAAIWKRKSIYHYSMEDMDEQMLHNIRTFLDHQVLLHDHCKLNYTIINQSKQKELVSNLNVEAPHYFVVYDDTKATNKMEYKLNAGYLLGQLALYITSKGLGSCLINMSLGKRYTSEKKFVAVLAFGKVKDRAVLEDYKPNRLKLDDICVYKEEISPDIKRVIKAASYAPSCMNSQPWRFVVYHNRIHIFLKKDRMIKRLFHSEQMVDIGFMLSNLLMEAENLWLITKIDYVEGLIDKTVKGYDYILSILIE